MEDDFFDVALGSGLLLQDAVDELRSSVRERGVSPAQAAMERGALTAIQVDIVDTLRRPRDVIPGYEILSLVGQGGMGVVFRARQLAFDRIVALKMVLFGTLSKSATFARFEQEARTIGRLLHPHIVTAYDFGRQSKGLFLVMEFVEGEDAEQRVSRTGAMSPPEAWGLIRQAASGLAYAAGHGVIHRDIKPANLLLVPPPLGYPLPPGLPLVKIADFGLALLQEEGIDRTRLTLENTTVGSPQYMAPEQLSGSRVDERADIYALGATAYHLLTGKAPFHGASLHQVFAQKLQTGPMPLAEVRGDLPSETLALVESMMEVGTLQRVPDYATLLARIDQVLADRVEHIPPPTVTALAPAIATIPSQTIASAPTVETVIPRRTMPRWWWTAAAVLVIAIVGVSMLFHEPLPVMQTWAPTGWAAQCFNGRDLKGWRTVSGQWQPGHDDEGAGILSGSGGSIAYPLTKPVDSKPVPLAAFRILVLANLHQARAIEIQCGLRTNVQGARTECLVLHVDEQRIKLGYRPLDRGPLERVVLDRELPIGREDFHELQLERQPGAWVVKVDGEPLGTAPVIGQPIATEFLLTAEKADRNSSDAAWFSDITLEELGPPR